MISLPRFGLSTALFAIALALTTAAPSAAQDGFDASQKKAIEEIVRDYIRENPEIVLEAIETLQQRERMAREEAQTEAIAANREALVLHPESPTSGADEPKVTIVEFFDYQCGYCKQSLPAILQLLDANTDVQVVWKEMPMAEIFGPTSHLAAKAAMAADKQGKYLELHVALMSARSKLTEQMIFGLAEKAGLDMERLQLDMADPKIEAYLKETRALADALGIRGTPAFVIGDALVPGAAPAQQLQGLIDQAREKAS